MNNWDLYKYSHKGNGEASNDTRFKDLVERTITSVEDSDITTVGSSAFWYATALESVNFPNAQLINNHAFRECHSLTDVNLPNATTVNFATFQNCAALTRLDFPALTYIADDAFNLCGKLETVILRSKTVCKLGSTKSFQSTPIANGTGYIYVPSSLVDSYKTATNWTVYADQIRAIEDYPEITGG